MDLPLSPGTSSGVVKRIAAEIDEYNAHGAGTGGIKDKQKLKEWLGGHVAETEQRWRDKIAPGPSAPLKSCSESRQAKGDCPVVNDEESDNSISESDTVNTVPEDREQSMTSFEERELSRTPEEKVEHLQAQYAAAKAQTKEITDDHQDSEHLVASLTEEVNALRAQRKRLLLAVECSDETVADLQSQVTNLGSKLAIAQGNEQHLRAKLQESQTREEQLQKQLLEARHLASLAREQENKLNLQIQALQSRAGIDRTQMESENNRLHQAFRRVKSENSRLRERRHVAGITRNGDL